MCSSKPGDQQKRPGMNGLPAELLLQIVGCLEDAAYFYKVLVMSKEFRKATTQYSYGCFQGCSQSLQLQASLQFFLRCPDSNWALKAVPARCLQGSKRSTAKPLDIVGQVLKLIKLPNRVTQLSKEVLRYEDSQLALLLPLVPNWRTCAFNFQQ